MVMEEQWRTVKEFSNYVVSNHGRVAHSRIGRILPPREDRHGLLRVMFTVPGRQYFRYVDELVAEHFLDDFNEVYEIEHVNGDMQDNAAWNLRCVPVREEWRTIEEAPRYQVSSLGRVRNRVTGRILKPTRGGFVSLMDAGYRVGRSCQTLQKRAFSN